MLNLRSIPTKPVLDFPFLMEVDFVKLALLVRTKTDIVRPAGREDEIEAMRLTLMSSGASSVWLMGDEGVGKTTIISGLLQKIANREVGPSLLSRRFFIFGAHAFFKLSAAERPVKFDACMEFLNKQPSILLFDRIDDFIDTAINEANFYANALIDGLTDGTQAIIASQLKNRDKIHESSTGFAPTFVEQIVKSPDKDGLLYMLRANRLRLETEHDVSIPEEAIREVARILLRYPGRAFTAPWPQGPLDLLDKTAAYVRMSCYNLSPEIMQKSETLLQLKDEQASIKTSPRPVAKRLAEIATEIAALEAEVNPARAAWEAKYKPYTDVLNQLAQVDADIAAINGRAPGPNGVAATDRKELEIQRQLKLSLEKKATELADKLHADRASVGRGDIQKVFANASGMTLTDISGDERARLLNAEQELNQTVFGQDASLAATANVLRDARSGVSDPDRPAGIIMYTGPTGVGKTEEAKALAVVDGGEGAKPITFPMNKYKDQSAVSEFRGPAPGLIGYSEEGPPRLREVRRKPRSVILFDEIEKANEELFDVIMTITDEGTMDDSASNTVSFKDGLLIFTTNVVLPEDVEDYLKEHPEERSDDPEQKLSVLRNAVKAKINRKTGRPFFKPEFIERLDMIVMFDYLGTDAAKSILRKQIANQNKTLETKNYRLTIDDSTVDALTAKFFKAKSNGRTVRQYYNRLIRPQITSYLLKDTAPPHENDDAKVISVMFDGENVIIQAAKTEMKEAA